MRLSPAAGVTVVWVLAWLIAAAPARAAALPAAPAAYVTDRTGALSGSVVSALDARLARFEAETSNQIVVYVDREIPDDRQLEEYATDLFEGWGVGRSDVDNGVLFLVFTEDRRARIEVGYGLEGALPDATANRILVEQAIPSFAGGDWDTGVGRGVEGIIAATQGEYEGTGRPEPDPAPGGRFPAIPAFFLIFILPPILRGVFRSRRYGRGRSYGPRGWWVWPLIAMGGLGGGRRRGRSGGFGRGSFGGGGFSGGGGLSGGGGASGGW